VQANGASIDPLFHVPFCVPRHSALLRTSRYLPPPGGAFLRGSVILDHLHGAVRDADRGKVGHGLAVRLGVHGHALLAHRRQHLEVVDVVGWREGVEEFSFFLEGVRLVSPGETGISLCG
jgi:hypothetical protein